MIEFDIEDELLTISDEKQYFFFKAGGDIYALEAQKVTEMVEYQSITKVPLMKEFVKGVTNIRGSIITVIDLLQRLDLGTSKIDKKTSLVIIDKIAIIIDEVHEVDTILQENIKDSIDFGFKIKQKFIKNMAMYEDEYIAILNCDELLNIDELSELEEQS